jgi:CBS domain-containing protein
MTVKEIMNTAVATCAPETDLAAAIAVMRDRHCGFLPVIDARGAVAGVLTDRDACLAAGDSHRPAQRISVLEAMSAPAFSCLADENVKAALATMGRHRIRRLPVVDKSGRLLGVLSMDDVVHAPQRRGGPTAEDIVSALKAITAAPPVVLAEA